MGAIYAKVRGNTYRLVVNEQGQLLPRDQRPLVQICERCWQDPCGCRPAAPLTHTGSVPPVGGRSIHVRRDTLLPQVLATRA